MRSPYRHWNIVEERTTGRSWSLVGLEGAMKIGQRFVSHGIDYVVVGLQQDGTCDVVPWPPTWKERLEIWRGRAVLWLTPLPWPFQKIWSLLAKN